MKNIGLSKKIAFIVIPFFFALLFITHTGLSIISLLANDYQEFATQTLKKVQIVNYLQISIGEVAVLQKKTVMQPTGPKSLETMERFEKIVAATRSQIADWQKIIDKDDQEILDQMKNTFESYLDIHSEILKVLKSGDQATANEISESKASAARRKIISLLKEAEKRANEDFQRAVKNAETSYHSSKLKLSLTALFAILLGSIFAYFVTKSTTRSLKEVSRNLTSCAQSVFALSSALKSQSEQLASTTTEQASQVQQTAAAAEELRTTVSKNATQSRLTTKNINESANYVGSARVEFENLNSSLNEISNGTDRIIQQVEQGNQRIGEVVQVISEISGKTKVINDIVFQTKLLSFNASVEAARAGEHGKGFAVVAEEVGQLAIMSGDAAKEISTLLEGSLQKVEDIIHTTQREVKDIVGASKSKVEAGVSVGHECSCKLDEIVKQVKSGNEMVAEISSSTQEQAKAVNEISQAITQMEAGIQMNRKSSDACASTARDLTHEATVMKNSLQRLLTVVYGVASDTHEAESSEVGAA